jgi:hypothetical protein
MKTNGSETGTVFTSASTNHGVSEASPVQMMSPDGKRNATKAGQIVNPFNTQITQSGVDRAMRGK